MKEHNRSLLYLSPGLILLLAAAADAWRFADTGLWGHVRHGQLMLSTGHVVRYDPYSYSAPDHLWRDYEWLSQVVLALAYNAMGVVGLKLVKFGCAAVTISFLALGVAETNATLTVQRTVLGHAALALVIHLQIRPQLFTLPLLAALMWLLERQTYRGHALSWLVVPMFALWANLHAGFIAGLAALATYSVASIITHIGEPNAAKRAARLTTITIAAAAATLVNPYGLGDWYAVAATMSNLRLIRGVLIEWMPLLTVLRTQWAQFKPGVVVFFFAPAILSALTVAVARGRRVDDIELLAVAALFGVAAFISIRNMGLAVVASIGPLAHHWTLMRDSSHEGPGLFDPVVSDATTPSGRRQNLRMVFLAAGLAAYTGFFSTRLDALANVPVGAAAYMREHNLHGNLLCWMEWGDHLIWHLAPASKVFVDGRWDTVYPVRVLRDDLDFSFGTSRTTEVLASYPHDFAVIPSGQAAYEMMMARPDWKLIYRDPVAALFARKSFGAPELSSSKVVEVAPPSRFP